MMRLGLIVVSPLIFFGCDGADDAGSLAVDMTEVFHSTGTPTWEFLNANPAVSYKLIGTLAQDRGDENVYTVKYAKMCMAVDDSCNDGELVRAISWSNDAVDGVLVHELNDGGVETTFDPPLAMATPEMFLSDQVVTQTAGMIWTSTLVSSEECPVLITGGITDSCLRISLTDGGAGATNSGLVGEYWAVAGYGIVAMDVASDEGRWELLDYECDAEDC